jgi:hypothetical protein
VAERSTDFRRHSSDLPQYVSLLRQPMLLGHSSTRREDFHSSSIIQVFVKIKIDFIEDLPKKYFVLILDLLAISGDHQDVAQ